MAENKSEQRPTQIQKRIPVECGKECRKNKQKANCNNRSWINKVNPICNALSIFLLSPSFRETWLQSNWNISSPDIPESNNNYYYYYKQSASRFETKIRSWIWNWGRKEGGGGDSGNGINQNWWNPNGHRRKMNDGRSTRPTLPDKPARNRDDPSATLLCRCNKETAKMITATKKIWK